MVRNQWSQSTRTHYGVPVNISPALMIQSWRNSHCSFMERKWLDTIQMGPNSNHFQLSWVHTEYLQKVAGAIFAAAEWGGSFFLGFLKNQFRLISPNTVAVHHFKLTELYWPCFSKGSTPMDAVTFKWAYCSWVWVWSCRFSWPQPAPFLLDDFIWSLFI